MIILNVEYKTGCELKATPKMNMTPKYGNPTIKYQKRTQLNKSDTNLQVENDHHLKLTHSQNGKSLTNKINLTPNLFLI